MPRFSVIVPVYNAADALVDTLANLQSQTCEDWEAVCIDDGSTDDSKQILLDFAANDPRFRLAVQKRRGPSVTRNRGALEFATGDILAFLNAGDLWAVDKLDRLAAAYDDKTGAIFGRVSLFRKTLDNLSGSSKVPEGPLTIEMLLSEDPVCTMSNFSLKRSVFMEFQGFDTTLTDNEALAFQIRLVGSGIRMIGDPGMHVFQRAHEHMPVTDTNRMWAVRNTMLRTAAQYGVTSQASTEAIYARLLARRALKLDDGHRAALRYVIDGVRHDARAFLLPLRCGVATALAAGRSTP